MIGDDPAVFFIVNSMMKSLSFDGSENPHVRQTIYIKSGKN